MTNVLLDLIFNKSQKHINIIPHYITDIVINISNVFINTYSDLCENEYAKIKDIKTNYMKQYGNNSKDSENLEKLNSAMKESSKLFDSSVEKIITERIDELQLYGKPKSKTQTQSNTSSNTSSTYENITYANIYLRGNLNPSKIVQYNHMQKLYNEYTKANLKEKFLLSHYYKANIFGSLHNTIVRKYDTVERDFLQKIRKFIISDSSRKILIIDDSDLTLLQCIYLYLQGYDNIYFGSSTKSYTITKIDSIVSNIKDFVGIYDDITLKNFLFIAPTVIQLGMPTLMFCQCDVDSNNLIEIYKICEKIKHPITFIGKLETSSTEGAFIETLNNDHLLKLFKLMFESEDNIMSRISEKITNLKTNSEIFNPLNLTDKKYKDEFLYNDLDDIDESSKKYILTLVEHYALLNNSYIDIIQKQLAKTKNKSEEDPIDTNDVVSLSSIIKILETLPKNISIQREEFNDLFKKMRFTETGQRAKKTNRLYRLL